MLCPLHRNAGHIRLMERKSIVMTPRSLLMISFFLLLISHDGSCRPSQDDATDIDAAKSQEMRRIKSTADVTRHDDHPVIYYKEDFVSEDYDPFKDMRKNLTSPSQGHRKYKDISRRRLHRIKAEQYRALKPEKIYFDFLPKVPVVLPPNRPLAIHSKIEPHETQAEASNENRSGGSEVDAAENKGKRPKKYKSRQRRDTSGITESAHRIQKRVPNYAQTDANHLLGLLQNVLLQKQQQQQQSIAYVRHPVKGIYYNTISLPGLSPVKPNAIDFGTRFGDENETDRVVWRTKPSPTTRRPVPPLFHDSNPENWDTSFLSAAKSTTTAPVSRRPVPPLFHDSNPENWDTSFLTPRPVDSQINPSGGGERVVGGDTVDRRQGSIFKTTQSNLGSKPLTKTTLALDQREEAPTAISQCVWAIVSCCSPLNQNIRNECFEAMNCGRNFWGLNPCSDKTQEKVLQHVTKFLT